MNNTSVSVPFLAVVIILHGNTHSIGFFFAHALRSTVLMARKACRPERKATGHIVSTAWKPANARAQFPSFLTLKTNTFIDLLCPSAHVEVRAPGAGVSSLLER